MRLEASAQPVCVSLTENGSDIAPVSKDFFLARQPILDRHQQLFGYELLFRTAAIGGPGSTDDLSMTASVIAHLMELGMEQVVGNLPALVNIDAAVLSSDFIEFLPRDKVILEILETVEASPAVLARMRVLNDAGFQFALDDVTTNSDDVRRLLPLAGLIKVDIKGMPREVLRQLVGDLQASGIKLLAEKVETLAEFEFCLALGFDYFQGYYFAKPVVLQGKKLSPSQLAIMDLLSLIDSDAESAEIETAIKRDALISINLLRLVNTPAAGATSHIDSLGQALMVLGRRQLQRWLQILLYATPGKSGQMSSPLLQMAITRGKLLELIARKRYPELRNMADGSFTVGVMSLMDTLFSMPMSGLLSNINVTDDISHALLQRRGPFGDMLKLVEYMEHPDTAGSLLAKTLRQLGVTADELTGLQLETFEWVNRVSTSR